MKTEFIERITKIRIGEYSLFENINFEYNIYIKLFLNFIFIHKIRYLLIVNTIVQHWTLFFTGRTSWA